MEKIDCSADALAPLSNWLRVVAAYVASGHPDLTNRQMALLLLVYLDPGPHTVRGIAARLKVSKPVVTRILNALSALGYLRRQKDMNDLRNIFVVRTPEGLAFVEAFAGLISRPEGHDGKTAAKR